MSKIFKVFVSYAHEDTKYKDELLKHCALLVETEKIEIWTDDKIRAGNKFNDKIKEEVENCDIAILLVSSTYWSKFYIKDTELPLILEHEENRKIIVIPILINGERKIKYSKLNGRTLVPIEKNTLKAIDDFEDKEKAWDIIFDEIDKSLEEYEELKEQEIETLDNKIEESQHDILKVCIYSSSPLNNKIDHKMKSVLNLFKKYQLEITHKVLNENELLEFREYDYNLLFTKVNKEKIIIEDEYFMQKSITLNQLEEIVDKDKVTLFLDDIIENSQFKIKKKNNKEITSFLHNNFKNNKGQYKIYSLKTELPYDIDINKLNGFIGRDTDIEVLIRKILTIKEEHKILTIKGAGGLGKTTIVSKVTDEIAMRGKYKDGIAFVSCEYVKDYEDFENKITFAFNMSNATNFKEQLRDMYDDEVRLIILDNLETILHLDETKQIKELIRFISNYATIVTTSREVLKENSFEEVYELREFSTDEAEELFSSIYKVRKYNKKQLRIEVLENQLSNNPLAITLVANNLSKGKTTEQIKKELEDNFISMTTKDLEDIFDRDSDNNIERLESLFSSINYSYKNLSDKEKLAIELLSLFPDGILFENFKNFYNQKLDRTISNEDEKEKKLQELSRIKKESFSEKDLKSLEDKSLIVNNNQHINLQSIIGRFAHYRLNCQSEDKKIEFYKKAYEYNAFLLTLIHNKNISLAVRINALEGSKNNFLKCLEYMKHLELNFEKFDFIDDLCRMLMFSSPNKKIFERLNNLHNLVLEEKVKKDFFEIMILTLDYYYNDFDYVYNKISEKYPFSYILNSYKDLKNIELLNSNLILTIYLMEGKQFGQVKLDLSKKRLTSAPFFIGEYSIFKRYIEKKILDNQYILFEFQINANLLKDIRELKKYISSLHKTQIIEKVQSVYLLLKVDKSEVKLRNIKRLVVSNPFTNGLKTLMLAIKEDENCSKMMYEKAIEKLYHIRYYYVEAILLYCKYLKDIEDSDYRTWFNKGKELSQKHYYRYLLHQFNCLDRGVSSSYDENDYPLPEKFDYSEIIKEYNL